MRQRLLERGEAELVEEDFLGRPQHRLLPLRAATLDRFGEEELRTVDDVHGIVAPETVHGGGRRR